MQPLETLTFAGGTNRVRAATLVVNFQKKRLKDEAQKELQGDIKMQEGDLIARVSEPYFGRVFCLVSFLCLHTSPRGLSFFRAVCLPVFPRHHLFLSTL